MMTLEQLIHELTVILQEHPELADRLVWIDVDGRDHTIDYVEGDTAISHDVTLYT